jgi:hypothetical protein
MSLPFYKKVLVASAIVCGLATAPILLAQKPEAKPEAKPAATAEKKPAKRLPAYYKDIVDGTQREKIYALQEKYDAQIDVLADQIKAIQKQRDTEFESVLTAEQKSKLEKARADAKAKAAEKAAAKKAAETKTVEVTKPAEAPAKPVAPAPATKAAK